MGPNQPIPPAFTAKKNGILASLAAPESSYTDLSPKGSVDEAIKPLIERINALQGVITTSSCAGRVSVFLEGSKDGNVDGIKAGVNNEDEESIGQAIVPGGKGRGGRWLFVSHSPVHFHTEGTNLARRLGMCYPQEQCEYQTDMELSTARLARFQFEPMILHIMTASLHHAQPVLAAAISAGFRESGIQSLKNLDDDNAFPMVAIRSSGLALESIIGRVLNRVEDTGSEDSDSVHYRIGEEVHSLVTEHYLELLLKIANDRFKINMERMKRFECDLFRRESTFASISTWEDGKVRQARKRAEGLKQREERIKARIQKPLTNAFIVDENLSLDESLPAG